MSKEKSRNKLRWGVLGTGNITRQFIDGVQASKKSELVAVGSRDVIRAEEFCVEKNLTGVSTYGSYLDVLSDSNVDAVYVGLPNHLHHSVSLAALRAGKHVLCEKPLAMNATEAQDMVDVADAEGRCLVEAFMYRCHPVLAKVKSLIESGAIGELRQIRASFCFRLGTEDNIRYNSAYGGGSLMDVGSYGINFSRFLAGESPSNCHVATIQHATGVDEVAEITLEYRHKKILSSVSCGLSLQSDNTVFVAGTDGYLEIPFLWKPPAEKAVVVLKTMQPPRSNPNAFKYREPQTYLLDSEMPLYALEADAFAEYVWGQRNSFMPVEESLENMRSLDELQAQIV